MGVNAFLRKEYFLVRSIFHMDTVYINLRLILIANTIYTTFG